MWLYEKRLQYPVNVRKPDAKTAKMRNAMGYRFLRIFVVILLNGNISHASVIADFILNQFIIEE